MILSTNIGKSQRHRSRFYICQDCDCTCRCGKGLLLPVLICQFPSICRTGKEIPTYRRYTYNSGQSNSDLLADPTNAEIVIVSAMDTDLRRSQCDMVVQPAGRSPEQLFCCGDVNFGHSLPPNGQGSTRSSNKIVQRNRVVMQSDGVMQCD